MPNHCVSFSRLPHLGPHIDGSVIVSGDHTRSIQIATPTIGGLMKFAVKTVTCLGCKTPLKANNSTGTSAYLIVLFTAEMGLNLSNKMLLSATIADLG